MKDQFRTIIFILAWFVFVLAAAAVRSGAAVRLISIVQCLMFAGFASLALTRGSPRLFATSFSVGFLVCMALFQIETFETLYPHDVVRWYLDQRSSQQNNGTELSYYDVHVALSFVVASAAGFGTYFFAAMIASLDLTPSNDA